MSDDAVIAADDSAVEPVAALNDEPGESDVSTGGSIGAMGGLILLLTLFEKWWRRQLSPLPS